MPGRARGTRTAAAGIVCFLVLGMLPVAPPAGAQPRAPVRLLGLGEWRVFGELEGEFRWDEILREERTRSREARRLHQGVRLEEDGYVYHPRFLTFDVAGDLSWQSARQVVDEGSFEEDRHLRLGSYEGRVHLFRQHSARADWVAARSRSRVRVTDYEEREVDSRRQVFAFFWDRRPVPLELRHEIGRRVHTGTGGSDEHTRRTMFSARFRGGSKSAGLRLQRSRQRDARLRYTLLRDAADLRGSLQARGWRLSSSAQWWRQELDGGSESQSASFGLRREFGRSLRVSGGASVLGTERGSIRQRSEASRFQISHRLYESLNSELSVRAQQKRSGSEPIRTLDLGGSSRYRKRVPGGRLLLGGSLSRLRRDTRGGEVRSHVLERELRFDESDIILLPEAGIDTSSVQVTDSTGVVVHVRGLDYDLEPIGGGLLLRRLSGGAIGAGALVRVSYEYEARGRRHEELDTRGAEVGFTAGLGFYARLRRARSSPRGSAEEASVGFQPSRRTVVEVGWARGPLRLDWERVRRRDQVLPFVRERLSVRAASSLGGRWSGSLDASRGWTAFLDGGPRFAFRNASAQLRHMFRRGGGWALEGAAREDENESGLVKSWLFAARCVLRRAFGEITLEWREERVRSPGTGEQHSRRVFCGVERRLR